MDNNTQKVYDMAMEIVSDSEVGLDEIFQALLNNDCISIDSAKEVLSDLMPERDYTITLHICGTTKLQLQDHDEVRELALKHYNDAHDKTVKEWLDDLVVDWDID